MFFCTLTSHFARLTMRRLANDCETTAMSRVAGIARDTQNGSVRAA